MLQRAPFSGKPRPYREMPGPRRIPLLGMLNDIIHLGKPAELHRRISEYHDRYGDLFRIQIGTQQAVFVRDPILMRRTFQLEGPYPRHPLPESWTYFNRKHAYQRGLFFMDGSEWLQSRQILNKPMLKEFDWMEQPIRGVCEAKVAAIQQRADQRLTAAPFEGIESFLYKWSVEVVLAVMLGESFKRCQESTDFRVLVERFSRVVYDIFRCSSELMNIPPAIADRLNVQAWQKFERVVPETIRLANAIIEIGLTNSSKGQGLLTLMAEKLTRSMMMRVFTDFIIAAGDTTAFATVWALHLLAGNPKMQELVRADVVESGGLESTAIKGVVRETLRLYPVAPFIGRFIEKESTFGGYTLAKDTLVLLSLYSAGRDNRYFRDPTHFNPYRWQRVKETGDANSSNSPDSTPSASLPFAIGARSCIGQKIAQLQMHYLLSMILTKFELTPDGKQDEQKVQKSIKPILKLITVPNKPVKVQFTPLLLPTK
ncbi:cytochrome P450 315a1, mitochondrial [Anopheles nili]|uniref:cytochrome P450 315a1, mitochondrial n=1 Tax=Anopheles nili TaxID=185578 RepID=UPI00237BF085|nr:cytochrome P450 315a1, mitochondrial [Anopheles nili]